VRLPLPGDAAAGDAGGSHRSYSLHPSVVTGALQAGMRLVAGATHRPAITLPVHSLERLRVLSPCKDEMFAWVRCSEDALSSGERIKVDIDLIDCRGNICAEIRGLSFRFDKAAIEEAVELRLRQEAARQLRRPLDEIPADRSYFDLEFSSPAISNFIQAINRLLDDNLSPSVLFDHRDIRSLAAFLAATYPDKVRVFSGKQQLRTTTLAPLPRKTLFSDRLKRPAAQSGGRTDSEMSGEKLLEEISLQEAPLDDNYEKVTF
jgi:hypothetical protein